jgi:hypothetical protein
MVEQRTLKHTRAPWGVGHFSGQDMAYMFSADFEVNRKQQIAVVQNTPRGQIGVIVAAIGAADNPHHEADARLIAASPDMYEALIAAENGIQQAIDMAYAARNDELGASLRQTLEKVWAAIAKAEGRVS